MASPAVGSQDAFLDEVSNKLSPEVKTRFLELITLVQDRVQRQSGLVTVDMSSASEATAAKVLKAFGFILFNAAKCGRWELPTCLPDEFTNIPAFPMQDYADQATATKPYMAYLQDLLRTVHINLDQQGGFSVNDLRVDGRVEICVSQKRYVGVLDVGIVPAGVMPYSSIQQLRIGIVLRHMDDQQQAYRENTSSGIDFWRFSGQVLLQLLGTYCRAQWPSSLYLTDGQVYHRLQLRGNKVLCWGSLSPSQALYFMAQELKKSPTDTSASYVEAGGTLTEEEKAPLAQLHRHVGEDVLEEQVDLLLSDIADPVLRLEAAAELTHAGWPAEGVHLPEWLSSWYND